MDYGKIFSRAWQITWNNKALWLLGFLAGAGSGSNFNFQGNNNNSGGGFNPDNPAGTLPPEIQRQLERPEILGVVLAVICGLLIIALVFFVLSLIARGGLIGGIRLADDRGQVPLREAWGIGVNYFWRTFGLTIALAAPALVFGLLVVGFALIPPLLLCLIPLACVFVIFYLFYSAALWLAQFGIVLEDLSVFDAIRKGWDLLKANLAPVIILSLILFVVGLIFGLAMFVPLGLIAIPAVLAFVGNPEQPNLSLLIGAGLAFLCLLPVVWVVSSAFTTWLYSVWTLFYRQLVNLPPAVSQVMEPA